MVDPLICSPGDVKSIVEWAACSGKDHERGLRFIIPHKRVSLLLLDVLFNGCGLFSLPVMV